MPGEELFISYGTSEWFTDRGLVSQSAKPAQLQNSTGSDSTKVNREVAAFVTFVNARGHGLREGTGV